jgi:hypothetical protein
VGAVYCLLKFLDYASKDACIVKYQIAGGAEIDTAPLTQVENPAVLLLREGMPKSRRRASRAASTAFSLSP